MEWNKTSRCDGWDAHEDTHELLMAAKIEVQCVITLHLWTLEHLLHPAEDLNASRSAHHWHGRRIIFIFGTIKPNNE